MNRGLELDALFLSPSLTLSLFVSVAGATLFCYFHSESICEMYWTNIRSSSHRDMQRFQTRELICYSQNILQVKMAIIWRHRIEVTSRFSVMLKWPNCTLMCLFVSHDLWLLEFTIKQPVRFSLAIVRCVFSEQNQKNTKARSIQKVLILLKL